MPKLYSEKESPTPMHESGADLVVQVDTGNSVLCVISSQIISGKIAKKNIVRVRPQRPPDMSFFHSSADGVDILDLCYITGISNSTVKILIILIYQFWPRWIESRTFSELNKKPVDPMVNPANFACRRNNKT